MPLKRGLPTWMCLNAANDASESGQSDLRTGAPQYAGLNLNDYFDLTEAEANALSYIITGTLHAGRYRRIQVDSSATLAYVKPGYVGGMLQGGQPKMGLITTFDKMISGAHLVVFLNAITPGNYGFVQELGVANLLCGSSITKAAPNTGDLMFAVATGVVDDPTSQSWTQLLMGIALDPPSPNTMIRCLLDLPTYQG